MTSLPSSFNRRTALKALGASLLAAPAFPRAAELAPGWPSRPVRIIVTSAAGSPWDPMARHLADRLAKVTGQTFFVENRGGAVGMIGMDAVAKTTDGHTLGVMFMPHVVLPALMPRMPYDTLTDLVPITQVQWTYNVLVVRPSLAVNNMQELIAYARARPGQLSYSSGGSGTPANLMGEYFKQLTNTFMVHIPYRGPVPALQDLVGGRSDLMFASATAAIPHVRSGRLRALGVTATQRLPALPDVPTFAQAGFPRFEGREWAGIVAPSSIPREAVAPLNAEIAKALAEPEIIATFAQSGIEVHTGSPQAFQALIRSEMQQRGEIVKRANIRME